MTDQEKLNLLLGAVDAALEQWARTTSVHADEMQRLADVRLMIEDGQ